MLIHSYRLSSASISDDYKTKEDKENEYFEQITELDIGDMKLEAHSDPGDPVTKNRRNIMP